MELYACLYSSDTARERQIRMLNVRFEVLGDMTDGPIVPVARRNAIAYRRPEFFKVHFGVRLRFR